MKGLNPTGEALSLRWVLIFVALSISWTASAQSSRCANLFGSVAKSIVLADFNVSHQFEIKGSRADRNETSIYVGHQKEDGTYLLDQPANFPNRVDLETPFAHISMFSDLIKPIASTMSAPPEILARNAQYEWSHRKDDLYFSINFGVLRGPLFEASDLTRPERELDQNLYKNLIEPVSKIVGPLYESYRKQGPERQELLPLVIEQDRMESDRYMRFVISRFIKPMGYLQLLLSRTPSEKLHVSEAWGDQVADLVRQSDHEVVGELGRLHIVHPNDYQFDFHRNLVMELKNEKGKLKTNRAITQMLLQKTFSWAASDAKLDRMIFQINEKVEKVMLLNGIPLFLGQRRLLSKTWDDGTVVKELVFSFDREAILRAEEILMAENLIGWFKSVEEQPLFKTVPHQMIYPNFTANEYNVIKRLGLYQILFEGRKLPEDLPGDEFAFTMGLNQTGTAIEYLRSYLERAKDEH